MKKVLIRSIIVLFVSLIYIIVSVIMCQRKNYSYKSYDGNKKISKSINNDISSVDTHDNSYFARILIPKIDLDSYLYPLGSDDNNVDKNIEILKGSSMPDQGGNLILAAHNGLGRVAYFRNLHKLSILDEVIISYNGVDYKYVISDKYDVLKTGKVAIKRDKSRTSITLITCLGEDRQLVVIGYLR